MKNMKMLALAAATTAALTAGTAQAEQYYGFANVSANYLDWSAGTTDRTMSPFGGKTDYFYIEAEAGAGYDWGDVYGFIDFENPFRGHKDYTTPDEKADAFRVSGKGTIAINIGDTNFNYYGQIFTLSDTSGFFEQNYIAGISYNFRHDSGFWINPFLGANYTAQSNSAFFNGGMFGWAGGYDFNIAGQKFSISNWNEIEFGRDDSYERAHDGDWGLNGALAAWWHPIQQLTTGIQYRYAYHKLGDKGYDNGIIYTVKYNF